MIRNWTIVETQAAEMKARNPDWREGQCYFNALYIIDHYTANMIRGTQFDCFHDDNKIQAFMQKVLEFWGQKAESRV